MSDVMLHGVLLMPSELWSDDPLDVAQRRSRYVEASVRIRELEALLEACFDDAQDALAAHRKDVIEACARVAEQHFIVGHRVAGPEFAQRCAEKIRGLKSREMAGS